MSQNKEAYYQGGGGVNEPPKKGKKKYKSDPAIVVQPHFEEPFYRNYDYVSQPGVDGKTSKHGPGTGHNSMQNFKSIKDFLDTRRKKLKGKYKAKDKYIQDDGSITSKASRRMQLLKIIIGSDNNEIDFPIDDQITSIPTGSANLDNIDMAGNMAQIGGKTPDQLNYERDLIDANNTDDVNDIDNLIDQLNYDGDLYDPPYNIEQIKMFYPDKKEFLLNDPAHLWRAQTGIELIHKEPSLKEQQRIWKNWNLMNDKMKEISDRKSLELFGMTNEEHNNLLSPNKLLSPKEPSTYGLPDGLEQYEKENEYYSGNQYGTTNVGNTTYSNR